MDSESETGAATASQPSPAIEVPVPTTAPTNIWLRLFGLLIVLAVAFTSFLLASAAMFFGLQPKDSGQMLSYRYANSIAIELVSLALLFYVLRQNGQRVADIGLGFAWKDIGAGILLKIGAGIVYSIAAFVAIQGYKLVSRHSPAPPSIPGAGAAVSAWIVIFALVNPFFEELIVRAFTISEILALTGSRAWAIAVSVGLQTAYHLYQGVPYALAAGAMFLVFSMYYVRNRRILPVIVAHFCFDFSALVLYPIMKPH
jgi:membrane protease YdiL (CAAX protease family)